MVQSILQAAPVLGVPAAVGETEEADGLLQPRDGVVVVTHVIGHLRDSTPPGPAGWASLACIPSPPCPIPLHPIPPQPHLHPHPITFSSHPIPMTIFIPIPPLCTPILSLPCLILSCPIPSYPIPL